MATLFGGHDVEKAAYMTCGISRTEEETRLLVRSVTPVETADIISESPTHISIRARSYLAALKNAHVREEAFVFVHSHPRGFPEHSPQDDVEEEALFRTAHVRVRGVPVHASIIFSKPGAVTGRVWLPNGSTAPLARVRVIGNRFRFFDAEASSEVAQWTDRQVRALGHEIQSLLGRLTVGVVGVGGTGSAVFEQLVRLGVGRIIVTDPDTFDPTNVNRVYGSRLADAGRRKVEVTTRLAEGIGVGTRVDAVHGSLTSESVARAFRECDVLFGCTDDQWGRSILTRFALRYLIPVFDMGVAIDAPEQVISTIQGRVTTLLPGRACLFCRDRISAERVTAESVASIDPDRAAQLRREGYAPDLDDPAPAVIPFTSAVAAAAITEFLHRLTGCLGADRHSSETLLLISDSRMRTNDRLSTDDCFCGRQEYWGRGDSARFLDLSWRPE